MESNEHDELLELLQKLETANNDEIRNQLVLQSSYKSLDDLREAIIRRAEEVGKDRRNPNEPSIAKELSNEFVNTSMQPQKPGSQTTPPQGGGELVGNGGEENEEEEVEPPAKRPKLSEALSSLSSFFSTKLKAATQFIIGAPPVASTAASATAEPITNQPTLAQPQPRVLD